MSDPTADEALARLQHPVNPEERERQLVGFYFGLIDALSGVLAAMQSDMRQVANNIAAGRPPTSGLSDDELEQIEAGYRAAEPVAIECFACKQPTLIVRGGMCPGCHDQWVTDGRPDRGEWSAGRNSHPVTAASDW